MHDQFDVTLEDADLLGEVELTTNLIIAASEADEHLTTAEIDRILGCVLEYSDSTFDQALMLGFASAIRKERAWRIKRGDAEFKVFMGPEIQNHYLRPDDPANRLRGYSYGLRVAAEAWYEPTAEMMIAADVSLSSIATNNSARIAYGWRVLEEMLGGIYIGPEVQYFGSDGYRHGRLGMHITSMKTEDTEWSAAAGWARDTAGRSSPYVRLSILTRR